MKKYIGIFAIMCIILIILFDCNMKFQSQKLEQEIGYKFQKSEMKYGNIQVYYPKFENKKLNVIVMNCLKNEVYSYKNKSIEFDREIIEFFKDYDLYSYNNYLSIVFKGREMLKGDMHPTITIIAININMNDFSVINLEHFISFNDEMLISMRENAVLNSNHISEHDVDSYNIDNLFAENVLNKIGKEDNYEFYFKEDKLIFTFKAPHALGDYLEYSVPLSIF